MYSHFIKTKQRRLYSITSRAHTDNQLLSLLFSPNTADNTPPVIHSCPPNINKTLGSGELNTTVSWTEPTATDNSSDSGDLSVINSHDPGSLFAAGRTNVTYTFMDDAGNAAQCIFQVTINKLGKHSLFFACLLVSCLVG